MATPYPEIKSEIFFMISDIIDCRIFKYDELDRFEMIANENTFNVEKYEQKNRKDTSKHNISGDMSSKVPMDWGRVLRGSWTSRSTLEEGK